MFSLGLDGSDLFDGSDAQELPALGGLGPAEAEVVAAYNPGKELTYNPDGDDEVYYCRASDSNVVKVISRADGSLVRDFILDPGTFPAAEVVYNFIGYDSDAELLVVVTGGSSSVPVKAYIYDVDPDGNGTAELYTADGGTGISEIHTNQVPTKSLYFYESRWLCEQSAYALSYTNGYLFFFSKHEHHPDVLEPPLTDDPNLWGYWEGFKIMEGSADQPDPPSEVPEPAVLSMLALGGLCLIALRRNRRRRAKPA